MRMEKMVRMEQQELRVQTVHLDPKERKVNLVRLVVREPLVPKLDPRDQVVSQALKVRPVLMELTVLLEQMELMECQENVEKLVLTDPVERLATQVPTELTVLTDPTENLAMLEHREKTDHQDLKDLRGHQENLVFPAYPEFQDLSKEPQELKERLESEATQVVHKVIKDHKETPVRTVRMGKTETQDKTGIQDKTVNQEEQVPKVPEDYEETKVLLENLEMMDRMEQMARMEQMECLVFPEDQEQQEKRAQLVQMEQMDPPETKELQEQSRDLQDHQVTHLKENQDRRENPALEPRESLETREQLEEKVTLVQAHRVRLENRALLEMSRDQLEIQVPRVNPVTKEPRE